MLTHGSSWSYCIGYIAIIYVVLSSYNLITLQSYYLVYRIIILYRNCSCGKNSSAAYVSKVIGWWIYFQIEFLSTRFGWTVVAAIGTHCLLLVCLLWAFWHCTLCKANQYERALPIYSRLVQVLQIAYYFAFITVDAVILQSVYINNIVLSTLSELSYFSLKRYCND